MKHSDTVGHLADYADRRLAPAVEAEMREHIDACQDCRDWIVTYELLRRYPESFHPESEHLAARAAGQSVPAAIEDHLATCSQCWELVTNASHALVKAEASKPAERRGWSWNWRLVASLAAVFFVALMIGRSWSPGPRSRPGGPEAWAGPSHALVLSSIARSAESPEVLRIRSGQPYSAVALDLGDTLDAFEGRVTIRVMRPPDVVVWEADYEAQALAEIDIGEGLVMLQLPTAFLEPGVYQVAVGSESTISDRAAWQRRFAVVAIDE